MTNVRDGAGKGGFGTSVLGPKKTVHVGLLLAVKFLELRSEQLTCSQVLVLISELLEL